MILKFIAKGSSELSIYGELYSFYFLLAVLYSVRR